MANIDALKPELLLAGAGVLILLLEAFLPKARRLVNPLAILSIVGATYLVTIAVHTASAFSGLIECTPITQTASQVILVAALLGLLASAGYLRREGLEGGEYQALILWCCTGLLLMVRATELLTIFIALELLSICLYSLAGYHRRHSISTEAAIKYFLMGAFVSAFIVLGITLLYGATGTTVLAEIASELARGSDQSPQALVGLLLLIAGFGFKMSVVPFHAWAPDTYQGAPSPFVAFLSVAPKAASAIVLLRVLQLANQTSMEANTGTLIGMLSVASMLVGNLLALSQTDLKRMLAYSGIAHMGYLLIPMVEVEPVAWEPILIYLAAYALMNGGAFALVSMLYRKTGEQHLISELGGWGYRFPLLSICLTICLLSLGGIPPTLGFIAKYLIFANAIQTGHLALALVGVGASFIGIFYYLRVVYTLYMKPEVESAPLHQFDPWERIAAVGAAGLTLILGVLPSRLLDWAAQAVQRVN
jgi:NADH-quinone oxidoreductase subunit N